MRRAAASASSSTPTSGTYSSIKNERKRAMVDIVERLRSPMMVAQPSNTLGGSGTTIAVLFEEQVRADMSEAADEIVRLRGIVIDSNTDIVERLQSNDVFCYDVLACKALMQDG